MLDARETLVELGREALRNRDTMARRLLETIGGTDTTRQMETWAELHLQWNMRIVAYTDVALSMGLYKSKDDYLAALKLPEGVRDVGRNS